MYIPPKPKNDNQLFDILAFIIFTQRFSFKTVKKKWPDIQEAFDNFSVEKVAKYDAKKVQKLLNDKRIIRNKQKVESIVANARIAMDIRKKHDSVTKWAKAIAATHKKDPLLTPSLQEEFQQFKQIGQTTSGWLAHFF